jgi:hypothetical protein
MTAASDLWAAVVASYDSDGLIALTNVRDRGATSIDETIGTNAAQAVVDLWPIYAQAAFDETNATHVEVGKRAVVAVLWSRGGASTSIAKVEWDEVFSPEGMIARVQRTGARGRQGPSSNSGVQTRSELANGRPVRGWSDRDSLPVGYLPRRTLATED